MDNDSILLALRGRRSPKAQGRSAMSMWARPQHKAVARTVGYALTLGSSDAWVRASQVIHGRLAVDERAALAWASLITLEPDDAALIAQAAVGCAGQPIAPLFDALDEAAFWADMASREELEAYCLASFNAMQPARQTAFRDYVQGGQAA